MAENQEVAVIADWPQVKAIVFNNDAQAAARWIKAFRLNGRAAADPKTGALIRPYQLGDRRWYIRGYQADNRDAHDLAQRIQAVPMPSPADRIRAEHEKAAKAGHQAV